MVTPFQAFPTLDGWMVIAGVKDWQLFCTKIGRDDLLHDERFQTNPDRTDHHADLEPILYEAFKNGERRPNGRPSSKASASLPP